MINTYKPEGALIYTPENKEYISTLAGLERAMREGKILEATVLLCDNDLNLHIDLYGIPGIIEHDEVLLCREGETIKDIAVITRVGKPVAFKVIAIEPHGMGWRARLSRRAAQLECAENYLSCLECGDIIPAKVTHLEAFGAFLDIGCGISSLLSIDCMSVSRISHPRDRLSPGMNIFVAVKTIDKENERIFVTQRELLGTWEENAALFSPGQTVTGIVRSVENYGIFVELAPNLAGLAELRDEQNGKLLSNDIVGECAAVYIKSIIPERMKIKLVLIDVYHAESAPKSVKYFVDCDSTTHIDRWLYSPESSQKRIETVF